MGDRQSLKRQNQPQGLAANSDEITGIALKYGFGTGGTTREQLKSAVAEGLASLKSRNPDFFRRLDWKGTSGAIDNFFQ